MKNNPTARSVTGLIPQLAHPIDKERERTLGLLWERYGERLQQVAQKQLRNVSTLRADDLEAAMSGFMAFSVRARHDEDFLARLTDRDSLFAAMLFAARDKARGHRQRTETEKKRLPRDPVFGELTQDESDAELADRQEIVDEIVARLQGELDPKTFAAGMWTLKDATAHQIAAYEGWSPRTAQRRVRQFSDAARRRYGDHINGK
jgi:hypothetical protein